MVIPIPRRLRTRPNPICVAYFIVTRSTYSNAEQHVQNKQMFRRGLPAIAVNNKRAILLNFKNKHRFLFRDFPVAPRKRGHVSSSFQRRVHHHGVVPSGRFVTRIAGERTKECQKELVEFLLSLFQPASRSLQTRFDQEVLQQVNKVPGKLA